MADLFVPLLVEFASDDAIIDASINAEHVFVRSLAFCKRTQNDGRFTLGQLSRECDKLDRSEVDKACEELVTLGLYDLADNQVLIPSWLKHNPSRDALNAQKEAKRLASIEGNHKRWHTGPDQTPKRDCELCFPSVLPIATPTESPPESGAIPKRTGREQEEKGRELTTSTKASCNTQEGPDSIEASESGASELERIIEGRITNPLNPKRLQGAINFATRTHPRPKVIEIARNAIGTALAQADDDPIGYATRMVTDFATETPQPVAGADKTTDFIENLRTKHTDPPPADLRKHLR